MQKLLVKLKNIPRDTSLVPCSISSQLNKEETLSAVDKVLANNIPEENLRLPVGGSKTTTLVYVLNKDGSPLMPCKSAKARHLIQNGIAKIISSKPFTIQLKWNCEKNTQQIILGIDPGYSKIGFSAVSGKKELISGELKIRADVSKKLLNRKIYRKNRRSKLWYREPRFLNRISSKKEGWLAPSIQHKFDSHIRLLEKIKKLLPISEVVVEVANFNIQKIKNPEISGVEYQQGEQLGFYNLREYILHRDDHKCQHCKGKSGDKILQLHHIRGKKEGATNRLEELLTLCRTCHDKHHKGIISVSAKDIKTFKPETFMSTIRWKLVNRLNCQWTFGYITKSNRIKLGLNKSHNNDAFVIAGGSKEERISDYSFTQIRRNNRCLQKNRRGFKPSIRRQRYKFNPNDLVRWNNQIIAVKGVHCLGKRIVLDNKKSVKINKVQLYQYSQGRRRASLPHS